MSLRTPAQNKLQDVLQVRASVMFKKVGRGFGLTCRVQATSHIIETFFFFNKETARVRFGSAASRAQTIAH